MKGDFSRLTSYEEATRVLMQQGRVLLDADWNELVEVLLRRIRTLGSDLIGAHGGPADRLGYAIVPHESGGFGIGAGCYYVDGWRCETRELRYDGQPDLPELAALRSGDPRSLWVASDELWGEWRGSKPPNGGRLLVYLDVWERHVSAAEAISGTLADVALGGIDTATRAVLMAQVRIVPAPEPPGGGGRRGKPRAALPTEDELLAHLHELFPEDRRPELKARAQESPGDADPCLSDPDARYRGHENQLYRVEIHRGGPLGKATFKWSRDNGAVVFPVEETKLSGSTVELRHLGRDPRSSLKEGDRVELVDEVLAKRGAPGPLLRIEKVYGDQTSVSFTAEPGVPLPGHELVRPILRRWDHRPGLPTEGGAALVQGALLVSQGTGKSGWLKLEDGVEIQFQPPEAGAPPPAPLVYRSGDYWLIPARTATGDVEWPGEPSAPLAAPPRGIRHAYAPLALIALDAGGKVTVEDDCRRAFESLAKPLP